MYVYGGILYVALIIVALPYLNLRNGLFVLEPYITPSLLWLITDYVENKTNVNHGVMLFEEQKNISTMLLGRGL